MGRQERRKIRSEIRRPVAPIFREGGTDIMKQSIAYITLVVRDYDEAIDFYTSKLNFEVIEDTCYLEQKNVG